MGLLTLIGFAVVIAGFALLVQGIQRQQGGLGSLGVLLVAAGVVIAIFSRAFVIIGPGQVGVVFNIFSGVQDKERGEGLQIILPVLQQVEKFSAREQELTFASENNDDIDALSQEGLSIGIDATIRYQIIRDQASTIYQTLGKDGDYQTTLIRPQVRSIIRNAVAKYKAVDLISTKRTELESDITTALNESLRKGNITLIEVLLRDVRIPRSVSEAIEQKQTAEQQVAIEENRKLQAEIAAKRAKTIAEGERDAAIARAQGEAEALSLRGKAIRENPEIIQLEIAQKLSPSIQTIMLPSEGNFLLDVGGLMGQPAKGLSNKPTSSTSNNQ